MTYPLYVFSDLLINKAIVDDYEFLRWNIKYRQVDNFELKINRYKVNVDKLTEGSIIAFYKNGNWRAGIIESKELRLTEEGKISESWSIIGRGLDGLLSERIALYATDSGDGYDNQYDLAETVMRHYVDINCISSSDTDRNYSLLDLEADSLRGVSIYYSARFQFISEILEEISLASGLGWEVVLDTINQRLKFRVLEGLDRSWENGVNSVVVFSPEYGNIKLLGYKKSRISSKNVAYVAGQGDADTRDVDEVSYLSRAYTNDPAAGDNIELEIADTSIFTADDVVTVSSSAGSETATITVVDTDVHITVDTLALNHTTTNPLVSTTYTGTARREFLIDARDLDATDKMLQRGNERLVELGVEEVMEFENLNTGPFEFETDFNIGDIVTVTYPGISTMNTRIIEVIEEISADNLISNKLIVGRQYPDLIYLLKYSEKNINPEIRR